MKVLIVALALALLLGAVPSEAGQAPATWVAGKSLGRLRVGMPMSDAAITLRATGAVEVIEVEEGKFICHTAPVGVCVFDFYSYGEDDEAVQTPGRVLAISTDDPRYVGFLSNTLHSRYGAAEFAVGRWEEWMSKGLAIAQRGGQVTILWVFRAR